MPKIKNMERTDKLPPVRVTQEEYQIIMTNAESVNMNLSEYIRFVALKSKIIVKAVK
jgi:hypothetical protein